MEKQRTVVCETAVTGLALHTGVRATLRMHPAPVNSGVVFRRIDLPGAPEVKALASNVVDVRRGTTIACGQVAVYTIEHIMSALHANCVDNVVVDMDGAEPPILDGSAKEYCAMCKETVEQDAVAKYFEADRFFHSMEKDTQIVMTPGNGGLRIACTASFQGCPFDPQYFSLDITPESYEKEIAGARTFVNYNDLKMLLAMGLCKGGSLDAAAILHNGAIFCKESLRYQNEIVRHKILDLTGDLFLCGRRVRGNVVAIKPGHPRNVALALQMQQYLAAQEAK